MTHALSSLQLEAIDRRLSHMPATAKVLSSVLDAWPEHRTYLARSFQARTERLLQSTERAATAVLALIRGREPAFAADYRWTCDLLREEELHFHREGRYRFSTFAEADAAIYSDTGLMSRYVNGLLLTQVLWYNHIGAFDFFLHSVLSRRTEPFRYLEIGPGHGLMTFLAASQPSALSIEAWDVSPVSLEETRKALDLLETPRPVKLQTVDILGASPPGDTFDLIVISEVIEHLEDPGRALAFLRRCIDLDGRIFINTPLNSPSPDHIYLFSRPEEVVDLIEKAGFSIDQMELFATQAASIDRALRNRISVSVAVAASPAP